MRGVRLAAATVAVWMAAASTAAPAPPRDPRDTYLSCLGRFEAYAESMWHERDTPAGPSGFFGDGKSAGNGGIRGSSGIAVAYATLARFGTPSERPRRVDRVCRALRYVTATHLSGPASCVDGRQWGHSWQSALWAGSLGLAAVLVEDQLPGDVAAACKRVVASEADRLVQVPPASGFRGDSRAEENAWNSNVLALAAAWLRDDPRSRGWLEAARRYLVNTYTVPDSRSDALRKWITTTTMYPSFVIENHGFFHPSYQAVAGMSLGDSLLMARLSDPRVAGKLRRFAEHNVLRAWGSLSHVLLDSGDFAYPSGLDWALHGCGQVSYYAWLASHFEDPLAAWAEERLAQLLVTRQSTTGDGRFIGDSVPDGFFREAVVARRVAIAYLHHEMAGTGPQRRTEPAPFVEHWPDVKLILQRSPEGFVSVSYGHPAMVLVVPSCHGTDGRPEMVTPRVPSILGAAARQGAPSATLQSFEQTASGFQARLELSTEGTSPALVTLASRGAAVALLEVSLTPRLGPPTSSGFAVGIENQALTGGARRLASAMGTMTVPAMSGLSVRDLGKWANVDDCLGMIVGPAGRLEYRAATGYNRPGAAEDTMQASGVDLSRPRYAIFLPAATARQTEAVSGTVHLVVEDGVAHLLAMLPDEGRVALTSPAPVTTLPPAGKQ